MAGYAGYADDVSVPELGNENLVCVDTYDPQGDVFGLGVLKAGSQGGALTRSVSRKRLSPEALAAGEDDTVPGYSGPQWGIVGDPGIAGLVRAYRSYPGIVHPPVSGVFARVLRDPVPGDARLHERPPTQMDPATRSHEVPEIRRCQGPQHTLVTATTAGSAFVAAVSSDGHVPSSVPPPGGQPYSDLLTGPAFSYAADGDGVFDADEINLGSLASGSYMLEDGDDDDGEEDCSEEDGGQLLRSLSISTVCSGSGERFDADAAVEAAAATPGVTWAASNQPLASLGIRVALRAMAAAGAIVSATDATLHAAAAVGSNCAGSTGGVVIPSISSAAALPQVTLPGANALEGSAAAGDGGSGGCFRSQGAQVEAAEDIDDEGLSAGLSLRSGSIESVGSADLGQELHLPSCNVEAYVASAGAAGGTGLPPPLADSLSAAGAGLQRPRAAATAAAAAAAAALLAPTGILGGQRPSGAPVYSAPVAGVSVWPVVGMPFVEMPFLGQVAVPPPLYAPPAAPPAVPALVAGPATAACGPAVWAARGGVPELGPASRTTAGAAAATLPLPLAGPAAAGPPPPSLLPPDVYLGFVTQLVESVRTAARAVDDAYQAERQQRG